MVATHLALAAVMCLLLFVHDRNDVWLLYLVTMLYGLGGDFFAGARSSMLKAMLPEEALADANGALQSLREGMRLVAPLAGAALFVAVGGSAVALVDAATFVLSAGTLIALRFVEPPAAAPEHHFLKEMSAGLVHIWHDRVLRQLTIGVSTTMLVIGFSETLIFAVTSNTLHRGTSFVAVLGTLQGVGSIAGGVTASKLMRRFGELRTSGIGIALFAVADALWLIPSLPVVLAAMAVAGVGIVWAVVAIGTAYQVRSAQTMQGRVNAAANMIFSVPQTISIAVGAALITLIDYRIEIVAMGVGVLLSALYLLTREKEAPQVELSLAA
jgi:MFS family permease